MSFHSWLRTHFSPTPKTHRKRRPVSDAVQLLEDRLAPATLYWDPALTTAGNDIGTGANLGGRGNWETPNAWVDAAGTRFTWSPGNDAVLWGTAGTVTLGTPQSANSVAFKTTGYAVQSSTLTLTAPATISTDAGV